MKKIALTMLGILIFALSSIFVIVSLVLSIIIIAMAKQPKVSTFAGITWIFIISLWLGRVSSGILIITTGAPLTLSSMILLQLPFFAFSIIPWIFTVTEFKFQEQRKIILIPISILIVSFLIPVFTFLFINPTMIGTMYGPFEVSYRIYIFLFLVVFFLVFLGTAIFLLATVFLQSEDQKIRTKGILLFIAFLLFTIGFIIDAVFPLNTIYLILTYGLFITSAVLYFKSFNIPYENMGITPKPSYQQTQLSPTSIPGSRKELCANCGTPLKENATFCTSCGLKLNR